MMEFTPAKIAAHLTQLYGERVEEKDITPIVSSAETRPDSAIHMHAPGPAKTPGFMQISPAANTGIIAIAACRAKWARDHLQQEQANHVPTPLFEGYINDHSFVVWPLLQPLSTSRAIFALQKRLLRRRLLDWVFNIVDQTCRASDSNENSEQKFRHALQAVAGLTRLDPQLRSFARNAMENEMPPALSCLQHGDLWMGNVLTPSSDLRSLSQFKIIDWAGANTKGYPFFDLAKLALSLSLNPRRLRSEIDRQCESLSCQPRDAAIYLVAALGHIAENLEHFPEDAFIGMTNAIFNNAILQSKLL